MYLPSHFEETRPGPLHELIHAQPLGLLVREGPAGAEGPVADALPFLLEPSPAPLGTLVAHVARANPVWREAQGAPVLVVFQGPQAYISPNWYPSKDEHGKVVPTWNYTLVQARGRLEVLDDAASVRDIVQRLTTRHEATQPRPWGLGDAPPEYIETLLRAIVGIRIPLISLVGKFKHSQNRPAAERGGVVRGLRGGPQAEQQAMADWVEKLAP
ncbi:MAG: FMN-binding negative transcriptional regulator [Burkholderiales bacterium]|nr:FMN-binding negative transcriptional regulator [Burkholderiales bacterium]